MATTFNAVKFIMLDFQGNWVRGNSAVGYTLVKYTANDKGCRLAVLCDEAGRLITYIYDIPVKEEVWVVAEIVHVPASKPVRKDGNAISYG